MQKKKTITLALQGGAALGAFIWGVLEELLADDRIDIEGVSGTSAGAVNAAVLASGLIGGDRNRARLLLEQFWLRVSEESEKRRWFVGHKAFRLFAPALVRLHRLEAFHDVMSRILLHYNYDKGTMDPLRAVIKETVNFDELRTAETIKLFVNATNINTVRNRVFAREEMSLDAICASSCLPFLFNAVEIDGEHYWDGAYMGNPTIYPLIYDCESHDVVIVLTNPLHRKDVPRTSAQLLKRISHVSFNATFLREMRAIKFVTDLIDKGWVADEAGLKKVNVHIIAPSAEDAELLEARSLNARADHLDLLRHRGQTMARNWLTESFEKIGVTSSVDLGAMFMDS